MAGDPQQAHDSTVEGIDGEIRIEIDHPPNLRGRGDPNNNLSISLSTVRKESIKVAQRTASQVQRTSTQVFHHCWDTEKEVEVSWEQAEFYNLRDAYRVARFDQESVAKILQKRRKKDKKSDWFGRFWSRVKENFKFSSTIRRIFVYPIIFLIGYYIIQIFYQLDLPLLCPSDITDMAKPTRLVPLNPKNDSEKIKTCRSRIEASFNQWNEHSSLFLKLFTFLIGFYVSNIVSRWWCKVRSVPEVENPLLVLSGLAVASREPNLDRLSLTSRSAITEVKKIVARYCLLSWTMCFNTFSQPLAEKFGMGQKLMDRELLTQAEFECLRMNKLDPSKQRISSDLWWIPLAWAVNLINELGPYAPKNQIAIPKDHKDVISSLLRFKKALEDQKIQAENQLPEFYKRLIWWALMGWIVLSMFMLQQPNHHKSNHSSLRLTLIANFPLTGVMVQSVLLGWLYMADILDNPFGFNLEYDINLAEILELNIWRCSVTIEQQSLTHPSHLVNDWERKELQHKFWNIIKPFS